MILHIAHRAEWAEAQNSGAYWTDSLNSDGFVHCSTPAQVLGPANAFYAGQPDLVLLVLDPQQVAAPIIYEDCYETGQQFPHIYGPIELDAIVEVLEFPPNADGSFTLPARVLEMMPNEA